MSAESSAPAKATRRSAAIDKECAAAVELARAAAVEVAGADAVGDHVEAVAEDQRVVLHHFESRTPGYLGWRWAVSVTRASRSKLVTVDEVVMLPGPGALLAPDWVPWSERLQPGDLSVGDLLPTAPDDDRLAPGYVATDDPAVEEVALEVGLGRVRVLSRDGRLDAAERWRGGETGPRTAMASHAPAQCGTCGFYLPLAGSLRAGFGACGNEFAPADGRVVAADYGCGAHSEALIDETPAIRTGETVYDDTTVDYESRGADDDAELGHS